MSFTTFSFWKRSCFALIITALRLFSSPVNAQSNWDLSMPPDGSGSANAEVTKGMCTDAAGIVYIVGVFNGASDFNLSTGGVTSPHAVPGSNDGYVASYDKNGNYRWHVVFGGTSSDMTAPAGAICTNGTNVWFTGGGKKGGSPTMD